MSEKNPLIVTPSWDLPGEERSIRTNYCYISTRPPPSSILLRGQRGWPTEIKSAMWWYRDDQKGDDRFSDASKGDKLASDILNSDQARMRASFHNTMNECQKRWKISQIFRNTVSRVKRYVP